MTHIEAMKQALDALRKARRRILTTEECHAAITFLNQAIAEAEKHEVSQEPVAWLSIDCIGERYLCFDKPLDNDPVQPLYTNPPQPAEPHVSVQWLAEMVMSDCGCSTNNQRLLERITARIEQHIRANTPPTAQPKREWVGLTDEDLEPLCNDWQIVFNNWAYEFVKAIEAKLKQKNQ